MGGVSDRESEAVAIWMVDVATGVDNSSSFCPSGCSPGLSVQLQPGLSSCYPIPTHIKRFLLFLSLFSFSFFAPTAEIYS